MAVKFTIDEPKTDVRPWDIPNDCVQERDQKGFQAATTFSGIAGSMLQKILI